MKINYFTKSLILLLLSLIIIFSFSACLSTDDTTNVSESTETISNQTIVESSTQDIGETESTTESTTVEASTTQVFLPSENIISLDNIPAYSKNPYVKINNNEPQFSASDKKAAKGYEYYSPLDSLGRCGLTFALVGKETMPTQERGPIGQVKPTGWHTIRYDIVDGSYLYNRCHLIGYQLTAENANERNLITGTRYLNVMGMLPFENMVADYVKETNNHVLYRVTPIFEGKNLLASGVQMEAYSLEDNGDGISFNVFCYNVQPGVEIDYSNGESSLIVTPIPATTTASNSGSGAVADDKTTEIYILNTNSKKFHYPYCSSVSAMSEHNKQEYSGSRQNLIDAGYSPCGRCRP